MNSENYYEIIQQKDHLIVIREKFDEIDPRYFTIYTNLYLIIGANGEFDNIFIHKKERRLISKLILTFFF